MDNEVPPFYLEAPAHTPDSSNTASATSTNHTTPNRTTNTWNQDLTSTGTSGSVAIAGDGRINASNI